MIEEMELGQRGGRLRLVSWRAPAVAQPSNHQRGFLLHQLLLVAKSDMHFGQLGTSPVQLLRVCALRLSQLLGGGSESSHAVDVELLQRCEGREHLGGELGHLVPIGFYSKYDWCNDPR